MYGSGWQLRSRSSEPQPRALAGQDGQNGSAGKLGVASNDTLPTPALSPPASPARALQGEPQWANEMPPAMEAEAESADSWTALRAIGMTDELLAEMRAFFEPYEHGLQLVLEALPVLGVHVV